MSRFKNNKNRAILTLVISSILILLFVVALVVFCYWGIIGQVRLPFLVGAIFICIASIIALVCFLGRRFNWRGNPDPLTKLAEEKTLEAHLANMEAIKNHKDMYEACDYLIKDRWKGRIITAVLMAVGLNVLMVIGLVDNKVTSIPIIICAILVVEMLSTLIVTAAILVEPSFIHGNKLKSAIIKQGFDADDVNNDFMHSTINRLEKGIMAVGGTYCIVYTSEEFRIVQLENIIKAEQYSFHYHMRYVHTIHYYIRLREKDNTYRDYKCADKLNADLMLNSFLTKDIKTETFPTDTKPTEA